MQRARSHRRLARLRRGGFYAGCTPAIQRAALVNLGELTTYDSAKKSIVVYTGDNLLCHLCSAICSGFVASLCSTPADVAKCAGCPARALFSDSAPTPQSLPLTMPSPHLARSRIMSQSALPDGTMPYSGTLDC